MHMHKYLDPSEVKAALSPALTASAASFRLLYKGTGYGLVVVPKCKSMLSVEAAPPCPP